MLFALLLSAATLVQADEQCNGLSKFATTKPKSDSAADIVNVIRAAAAAPAPGGVDCSSLTSVLEQAAKGKAAGGEKLEADRPPDMAAAQADLAKALQNPEIKALFDKLQHDVSDENLRNVYEAAVLDAEGFYNARDLRMAQVRERLKNQNGK